MCFQWTNSTATQDFGLSLQADALTPDVSRVFNGKSGASYGPGLQAGKSVYDFLTRTLQQEGSRGTDPISKDSQPLRYPESVTSSGFAGECPSLWSGGRILWFLHGCSGDVHFVTVCCWSLLKIDSLAVCAWMLELIRCLQGWTSLCFGHDGHVCSGERF